MLDVTDLDEILCDKTIFWAKGETFPGFDFKVMRKSKLKKKLKNQKHETYWIWWFLIFCTVVVIILLLSLLLLLCEHFFP